MRDALLHSRILFILAAEVGAKTLAIVKNCEEMKNAAVGKTAARLIPNSTTVVVARLA